MKVIRYYSCFPTKYVLANGNVTEHETFTTVKGNHNYSNYIRFQLQTPLGLSLNVCTSMVTIVLLNVPNSRHPFALTRDAFSASADARGATDERRINYPGFAF